MWPHKCQILHYPPPGGCPKQYLKQVCEDCLAPERLLEKEQKDIHKRNPSDPIHSPIKNKKFGILNKFGIKLVNPTKDVANYSQG